MRQLRSSTSSHANGSSRNPCWRRAGHACTTRGVLGIGVPQATAIADARAARTRHLDETGVYVHVIADGGMATGGDIAKAIVCVRML